MVTTGTGQLVNGDTVSGVTLTSGCSGSSNAPPPAASGSLVTSTTKIAGAGGGQAVVVRLEHDPLRCAV